MLSALLLLFYFHLGNSSILLPPLEFRIALCRHNMPFHVRSLVHFTAESKNEKLPSLQPEALLTPCLIRVFLNLFLTLMYLSPWVLTEFFLLAMIFNVSATYCRLLSPQPVHSSDGGVVLNFL